MASLKRLVAFFALSIIFCALFGFLFLSKAATPTQAAVLCPDFPNGSMAASDLTVNNDRIREEDTLRKLCSQGGIIGFVTCQIAKAFANLSGLSSKLNLQKSQMPPYLREANQLALSGDPTAAGPRTASNPTAVTGSIAKMSAPGYSQNGLNPIEKLTQAEGQLVTGKIYLNNKVPQKSFTETVYETDSTNAPKGYYDLKSTTGSRTSDYEVNGRFGEVAPLNDRFGLLKQALMPFAGKVTIPDPKDEKGKSVDCSGKDPDITFDPSRIAVTGFVGSNPSRTAPWKAYEPIPDADKKAEKLECTEDKFGNLDCPADAGSVTYIVGGNLDTQTDVSLASEAWENIGAPSTTPGGGGVFNILLPPSTYFRTEEASAQLNYKYKPHSSAKSPTSADLKIADLGNVGGAVSCVVNQLTQNPAQAAYGTCESAFGLGGIPIKCTTEATPLSFDNNSSSSIARRAWEIVNNMYQGFWCYWNWSKTDYPSIFNEELFRQNPNPSESELSECSECLFWCTYLVWKTVPDHGGSLNSQTMKEHFESKGKYISPEDATPGNIQPGYVVFFQTSGGPNRLNHVGVVYSVNSNYITFVQSNASTKSDTITFKSGVGVENVPWARVGGFGRP